MKHASSQGGMAEARALIAFLGGLVHDGDSINASVVATRLGIPIERARHLLHLLLMAGGETLACALPLSTATTDAVTLQALVARSVHGRPLRLTHSEAQALDAAFERAGLLPDDSLRNTIQQALYPCTYKTDDIRATLTESSETLSEQLDGLSRAILARLPIEFDYHASPAEHTLKRTQACKPALTHRHVGPLALRHERDCWYLDAYDLDRKAPRSFRVDRMGVPTTTAMPWDPSSTPSSAEPDRPLRMVSLRFTNRQAFEFFEWPGFICTYRRGDIIEGHIPWYPESLWLVRHIAACGRSVDILDEEFARVVRSYAHDILDRAAAYTYTSCDLTSTVHGSDATS